MGKIDPGEIFAETYRNAFRWIHLFMLVTLATAVVSILMSQAFVDSMVVDIRANPGAFPEDFWTIWSITMLGTMVVQFIQLSLFDSIMDRREDWFRFGITRALRRMLLMLVGVVIYLLAYFAGGLLLLIPGLMAAVLLMMMAPLILVDGVGPFEAVGKSWRLTWGNAWLLVAAALLTFVPMMLVFLPAGIALGVFSFDPQQAAAAAAMSLTSWQTWAWVVLSAFMGVFATSFYLVAFRALKAAKSDGGEAVSEMVPA